MTFDPVPVARESWKLSLSQWKQLRIAFATHGNAVFPGTCGEWDSLSRAGFVQIMFKAGTPYPPRMMVTKPSRPPAATDEVFVIITPDGEAALNADTWVSMAATTHEMFTSHAYQAKLLADEGWGFADGSAPLHLLLDARAKLAKAEAKIEAMLAGRGDATVAINEAVARDLVRTKEESERNRKRWEDAARCSDAERQRRQNSVRGTIVGREKDECSRQFLTLRVPAKDMDIDKYISMNGKSCWLVMFEDDDGQVPVDEPRAPKIAPSVYFGDD